MTTGFLFILFFSCGIPVNASRQCVRNAKLTAAYAKKRRPYCKRLRVS
jgi:hypothetical protein